MAYCERDELTLAAQNLPLTAETVYLKVKYFSRGLGTHLLHLCGVQIELNKVCTVFDTTVGSAYELPDQEM